MEDNYSRETGMSQTVHDFFYTVGLTTTAGIAYYVWNNIYPLTIERLIADATWWGLRLHTRANMIYEQFSRDAKPWMRMVVAEKQRHDVRFYKEGVMIASLPYLEALKYEDDNELDYDKVTYELVGTDESILLMIRDDIDYIQDREMKKSSTKFINVTLKREGHDDLDIDMASRGDLYVIGNELFTRDFFKWLIPDIELENDFTVSTIDDSVNIVEFTSKQYLVLEENGYQVKDVVNETTENIDEKDNTNVDSENNSWSFSGLFSKSKDE